MNEQALPEAVERVLQQFEAMAGAADWRLLPSGSLRTSGPNYVCPLLWMAGVQSWYCGATAASERALGLGSFIGALIFDAADGARDHHPSVRARLLVAAGLE